MEAADLWSAAFLVCSQLELDDLLDATRTELHRYPMKMSFKPYSPSR